MKRYQDKPTILAHFLTKCGIDTNVLVDLILYPSSKEYFEQRGYSFPDKCLCITRQVLGETKGVLIHKYGFSEEKADKEIKAILDLFFIEILPYVSVYDDIEEVERIGKKYSLNEEDIRIIYSFWKCNLKLVIVRDRAFEKTCEELNIQTVVWPIFP
ncbi:hypothetical protein COV18_06585 [Candidatus Woesearchaeota archaeon CG10_big_fil_rev_8_21_14_0_10_37_12]|nr:MAG: hypothetical protein COV18_06585 [Candidatus Woesearchaeota archaeon CG10_big_fil_rev_8_21_14_0_10_37_12]